jgi:hypothetical protein
MIEDRISQKREHWDGMVDERLTEAIVDEIGPYFKDALVYPEFLAEMIQFFGYSKLVEIVSRAQLARSNYFMRQKADAEKNLDIFQDQSEMDLVKTALGEL